MWGFEGDGGGGVFGQEGVKPVLVGLDIEHLPKLLCCPDYVCDLGASGAGDNALVGGFWLGCVSGLGLWGVAFWEAGDEVLGCCVEEGEVEGLEGGSKELLPLLGLGGVLEVGVACVGKENEGVIGFVCAHGGVEAQGSEDGAQGGEEVC